MRPHPNGGAQVLSEETHISHDSFCDKNSQISGFVYNSTIINSHIVDSQIAQAEIVNSILVDCVVTSLHGQRPSVVGVKLSDVVVEGDSQLIGPWELHGIARIPTGVWHRPPKFIRITGNGIGTTVTESTNGYALIACLRKPVETWLKAGPRYGRYLGWTDDQVDQARQFLKSL